MASLELPFDRGTTWDSGSAGAVPDNLIGSVYRLKDGTTLRICKNVDAAALSGGRLVRINSSQGSCLVNEASGAPDLRQLGISDYAYKSAAVTIPVNALFYVAQAGNHRCLFGNSVAAGQPTVGHATDGTLGSGTIISGQAVGYVGVTLAAVNSGVYGWIRMIPVI